jgi:chemotaxis protein CheX
MRYEYIEPFVGSTLRTLERTVPGTVRHGDVVMVREDEVRGDVRVMISITGDSQGDVILGMEEATALGVCAGLLGSPVNALTPLALDALAELGNMIAGNGVSCLNDLGFDLSVMPPGVTVQAGRAESGRERDAMRIPLDSPWGPMSINLILRHD